MPTEQPSSREYRVRERWPVHRTDYLPSLPFRPPSGRSHFPDTRLNGWANEDGNGNPPRGPYQHDTYPGHQKVMGHQGSSTKPPRPKRQSTKRDVLFAERLRRFLDGVSVVGAKYVMLSGAAWFRKAIWIVFVLIGIGFMTYQVFERIRYFRSNPITVDVRVNHNRTLRFPTVTICNENRMSKKRVAVLGDDVVAFVKSMNPVLRIAVASPVDIDFSVFDFTQTNWSALYRDMAQPKEEALTIASWDGQGVTASDFRSLDTNMGYCFQFNSAGEYYASSQAGATYGLKLILHLNQSDYLYTNEGSLVAGFRVALHAADEEPLMKEWGFRITPGFQTLAAVTMQQVVDYGPPYVECDKNESYSRSRCLAQCEADFIVDRCQCRVVGMPNNVPVCDPQASYECAIPGQSVYVAEDHQSNCICPRQCTSVTYGHSLSSAIIADHVIEFMGGVIFDSREDAEEKLLKDYTMLEIFFSQMSYEEIRSRPVYSILSLFCDIGGAMGLILGSTFLTFFEICDFIILAAWRSCGMSNNRVAN